MVMLETVLRLIGNNAGVGQFLLDGTIPYTGTLTYVSNATHTNSNTTYSGVVSFSGGQTLEVGMIVTFTQTTVKKGVVTYITGSNATIFFGTDYQLANAAITSVYFTPKGMKPVSFDATSTKWYLSKTDTSTRTQSSPTANTWYNLGSNSISLPAGDWLITYRVQAYADKAATTSIAVETTLSSANNTESWEQSTFVSSQSGGSATQSINQTHFIHKLLSLTANATYYLNTRSTTASPANISNENANGVSMFIEAQPTVLL